jgi:hypothetical protein
MIFIRIPSFLKGMMNLYAVDMSLGGCASFSVVAPQRKEIKERVKAVLARTSVTSVAKKSSVGCDSSSIHGRSSMSISSVEAPVKRSFRSARLECVIQFHGDNNDPKRRYSGHLRASTFSMRSHFGRIDVSVVVSIVNLLLVVASRRELTSMTRSVLLVATWSHLMPLIMSRLPSRVSLTILVGCSLGAVGRTCATRRTTHQVWSLTPRKCPGCKRATCPCMVLMSLMLICSIKHLFSSCASALVIKFASTVLVMAIVIIQSKWR